jgi:hypothetical protein
MSLFSIDFIVNIEVTAKWTFGKNVSKSLKGS